LMNHFGSKFTNRNFKNIIYKFLNMALYRLLVQVNTRIKFKIFRQFSLNFIWFTFASNFVIWKFTWKHIGRNWFIKSNPGSLAGRRSQETSSTPWSREFDLHKKLRFYDERQNVEKWWFHLTPPALLPPRRGES
jgi:hypothetical protein